MAPVIKELASRPGVQSLVCDTGQHKEMLRQILSFFDIRPDHRLDVMRPDQQLSDVAGLLLTGIGALCRELEPDWVVVQGDTVSAAMGGIAAYYSNARVAHIEAGLRTGNKLEPFPEEVNRRLIGSLADLHFAPTDRAVEALLAENIPSDTIFKTGNTAIDALRLARLRLAEGIHPLPADLAAKIEGKRLVLVTGHRRESIGHGLRNICRALADIARRPDVCVVYPVHLNPNVQEIVHAELKGVERVHLIPPLDYPEFIRLMEVACLLVTDSGGIQEEGPSMDSPVLVTRNTTERPEGVEAGCAKLVGTSREAIVAAVDELLSDSVEYACMAGTDNPYGDGFAASAIVDALLQFGMDHE